jgi:hypothetical protein
VRIDTAGFGAASALHSKRHSPIQGNEVWARLKGPVLVTPKQFNQAVRGTGIGLKVNHCSEMLRVPLRAEDQHFEIIGDTGSGKTTIIMQMLRQIQARGHSAMLYDPACEFVERFYDESRGDIVLNPLDRRCPYWGPSEELVRRAEARTIAALLFQPTNDKKGEFFIESPQKYSRISCSNCP